MRAPRRVVGVVPASKARRGVRWNRVLLLVPLPARSAGLLPVPLAEPPLRERYGAEFAGFGGHDAWSSGAHAQFAAARPHAFGARDRECDAKFAGCARHKAWSSGAHAQSAAAELDASGVRDRDCDVEFRLPAARSCGGGVPIGGIGVAGVGAGCILCQP